MRDPTRVQWHEVGKISKDQPLTSSWLKTNTFSPKCEMTWRLMWRPPSYANKTSKSKGWLSEYWSHYQCLRVHGKASPWTSLSDCLSLRIAKRLWLSWIASPTMRFSFQPWRRQCGCSWSMWLSIGKSYPWLWMIVILDPLGTSGWNCSNYWGRTWISPQACIPKSTTWWRGWTHSINSRQWEGEATGCSPVLLQLAVEQVDRLETLWDCDWATTADARYDRIKLQGE